MYDIKLSLHLISTVFYKHLIIQIFTYYYIKFFSLLQLICISLLEEDSIPIILRILQDLRLNIIRIYKTNVRP